MQRYSDGLAVPKLKMDVFTGKTTGVFGHVTCELTYTPKSIHHISIPGTWGTTNWRNFYPFSLVGKTLDIYVGKGQYYKADTPTGTVDSGGAGADPHSHAISHAQEDVFNAHASNELQGAICVHYVVA